MGIGTSLGSYYDDEHHYAASQWDDKYDNNVIDPDILNPQDDTKTDANVIPPSVKTSDFITQVSDVHTINPMTDVENGVIPLAGAPNTVPETVGKSAVVIQGKTYTGDNHGFALSQFMDENPGVDLNKALKGYKDGFMTSKDRFVSREEAFDIAKNQNQIEDKVLPSLTAESKMLLSEDLKPASRTPDKPRNAIEFFNLDLKPSPDYNHDAHVEWRNK